jgi:hypothetical protein
MATLLLTILQSDYYRNEKLEIILLTNAELYMDLPVLRMAANFWP